MANQEAQSIHLCLLLLYLFSLIAIAMHLSSIDCMGSKPQRSSQFICIHSIIRSVSCDISPYWYATINHTIQARLSRDCRHALRLHLHQFDLLQIVARAPLIPIHLHPCNYYQYFALLVLIDTQCFIHHNTGYIDGMHYICIISIFYKLYWLDNHNTPQLYENHHGRKESFA